MDRSQQKTLQHKSLAPSAYPLIPGTEEVASATASNLDQLASQMRELAKTLDRGTCRLVLMLTPFDRQQGWRRFGARSCVAWLNAECGLSPSAAYDRLRVAYALEKLPVMTQLFRLGELSWSKVRALTRIATPENERDLAKDALFMPASAIEQLARQYRDVNTRADLENEDAVAEARHKKRSLTYRYDQNGMVQIRVAMAPLAGTAFLRSLARAEDTLFVEAHGALTKDGIRPVESGKEHEDAAQLLPRQLRADALSLMAETHLGADDISLKTADRYQVIIHVDADTLKQTYDNPSPAGHAHAGRQLKSYIDNGPTIAASTARRFACDCSVSTITLSNEEPISIGRKDRIWPAPMRRAVMVRDCHCQFPGCTAYRHLDVHHVIHWADGGKTSVNNGMALCQFHHRLVHEAGYKVQRVKLEKDGKRPMRQLTVTGVRGEPLIMQSRVPRFRFIRKDGSAVT